MAIRTNKYNAKKSIYGGRVYDSNLEATYAEKYDWLKKAGEVVEVIPQYRLDLCVNNVTWRTYKIDFKVIYKDNTVDYVEVKGFPTAEWKMKWDMTIILFDELTKGENARLYLNDKLIKQSFDN